MDVSTLDRDGVTVIQVGGSMDATSVTDFDAEWKKCLEAEATKIVVEMSALEYISSAGLRGILMLAKMSKVKGVALGFAGMKSMVADMFKLSGFQSILKLYPDLDTALAEIK